MWAFDPAADYALLPRTSGALVEAGVAAAASWVELQTPIGRERIRLPADPLEHFAREQGLMGSLFSGLMCRAPRSGYFRVGNDLLARSGDGVVMTEFWPHGLERAGGSAAQLVRLLTEQLGPPLHRFCPEEGRVRVVTAPQFLEGTADGGLRAQPDLLARRQPRCLGVPV
jgi:hypothetical protein